MKAGYSAWVRVLFPPWSPSLPSCPPNLLQVSSTMLFSLLSQTLSLVRDCDCEGVTVLDTLVSKRLGGVYYLSAWSFQNRHGNFHRHSNKIKRERNLFMQCRLHAMPFMEFKRDDHSIKSCNLDTHNCMLVTLKLRQMPIKLSFHIQWNSSSKHRFIQHPSSNLCHNWLHHRFLSKVLKQL